MKDNLTQKHELKRHGNPRSEYPWRVPCPPKGLSGGHLTIKKQENKQIKTVKIKNVPDIVTNLPTLPV